MLRDKRLIAAIILSGVLTIFWQYFLPMTLSAVDDPRGNYRNLRRTFREFRNFQTQVKIMAKINLIQLLCPKRHCITALAFDPAIQTAEAAEAAIKSFVEAAFNPWCGICGSKDLQYETGETKFDTVAEAMPHLLAEERKNSEALEFYEKLRQTTKNN